MNETPIPAATPTAIPPDGQAVTLPVRRRLGKRRRAYLRSGMYRQPVMPGPDTEVGREIAARRRRLTEDLGGDLTQAQEMLVEQAIRAMCLLDSVDAFLLQLPSAVDRRHRRCWPVILDRTRLVEATLCRLGLVSLDAYLKARQAGGKEVSL